MRYEEMLDLSNVKSFTFSGGEVHVNCDDININPRMTIYSEINSSDDLMKLLLVVNALKIMGCKTIVAYIPYLPYARQDRACNFGDAFSLDVFARMLNASDIDKVVTLDPHSDVAKSLINLESISQWYLVDGFMAFRHDVLVAPDKGAMLKTKRAAMSFKKPVILSQKKRDHKGNVTTGEIDGDVAGKSCLIIDDICDGGATFIGLAEKLKEAGATKVSLWVTHGLFSKGKQHLLNNGLDEVQSANYKEITI